MLEWLSDKLSMNCPRSWEVSLLDPHQVPSCSCTRSSTSHCPTALRGSAWPCFPPSPGRLHSDPLVPGEAVHDVDVGQWFPRQLEGAAHTDNWPVMSSEMLLLLSGLETSLTSIGDSFRSGSLSEEKGFSKASLLIRSGQDSRSGKVGAGEVDPSSSKACLMAVYKPNPPCASSFSQMLLRVATANRYSRWIRRTAASSFSAPVVCVNWHSYQFPPLSAISDLDHPP